MKNLLAFSIVLFFFASFKSALPEVNQKVVEYCKSKVGTQVDRGECWDLAKFALDYAHAKWNPPYNYGEKFNYKKGGLLPGDIIQFENVTFKWDLGAMSFPHHTAVVMEVKGDGKITIAHQNFAGSKKVQLTELNLNYHKKGTLDFFHPVSEE